MKTPQFKDDKGNILANSIAKLEKIRVDDTEQYLLIRGKNKHNPIILFVHGGPGQGEIGYMRQYQEELENHFVVVRWDQRGAGLSYSKDINEESYNVDRFVKDLDEVSDYLIKEFNKPKIIIAGHSWGTVISMYGVKNNPSKYLAYIGIGQLVNSKESEKIAYEYTKLEAKNQNNKKVLDKLSKFGEPPYNIEGVFNRINCMGRVGGVVKTEPPKSLAASLLLSKEYNLLSKIFYQRNCMYCAKLMQPEIMEINLLEEIKKVEVPILFIAGKYDYITPTTLVQKFYENIEAPTKKIVVFDKSAHLPQLEENKRFNEEIIDFINTNN